MPVQVLRYLRHRTSQMAYNSALYDWSLRGDVPERLLVKPADPWQGRAADGQVLCEGHMPGGFDARALHAFVFLRDLQALALKKGCGPMARAQARHMVEGWIQSYGRYSQGAWDMDVTGERIAIWISHYDFFASHIQGASEDDYIFQDMFFESLSKQASHLSRVILSGEGQGLSAFKAAKGLLYAGLAFEGREAWIEQALNSLEDQVELQIAGDGGHQSRSPQELLEVLQILLDIRMALSAGDYPLPEGLQHAIDRMGLALQFFRCSDRKLSVFNGGQEGDAALIDSVLAQAGARGKGLQSLPCVGFEKMTLGRSSLIFDCGHHPSGHAGPLAFEMSHGKERLFVNCGAHPCDPAWQDALRATAAHNTVELDRRSVFDVRKVGAFARKSQKSNVVREENKKAVLVEASHCGYQALNGFIHARRLYLSEGGYDLRGEDVLSADVNLAQAMDVAVRFHLHPKVQVSLIADGKEALLRLPGGVGWRFHYSSGVLALEDSIYLGEGHMPRKTKQLVIYGQISDFEAKILWAVQREG